LFDVEGNVLNNAAEENLTRTIALENQDLIKRNFNAAFNGNRHLSVAHGETALRSKLAIIKSAYKGDDPVKVNHIEILVAHAKLHALDQRGKLNERVNAVNAAIVAANAQLIEINKQILEVTDGIVASNTRIINEVKHLHHSSKKSIDAATPEINAKLIAESEVLLSSISQRAALNHTKNEETQSATLVNRTNVETNSATVAAQRVLIQQNLTALTALRPSVRQAL